MKKGIFWRSLLSSVFLTFLISGSVYYFVDNMKNTRVYSSDSVEIQNSQDTKQNFSRKLFYFSLFIFITNFFSLFFFFGRADVIFYRLKILFDRISKGDYQITLDNSEGEVPPPLKLSFDKMIQNLEKKFRLLERKNAELERIFSVMSEILWIVDSNNRIVFANGAFYEFTGVKDAHNEFYWKFIRNSEIDTLIKTVRQKQKRRIKEIQQENATYICTADFLPLTKNIILILNDISEIREVEIYKKDLIMNVSHELKTPLTSIKGFVETLIALESDDEKRHYLKIINRNANRLSNIINDLLLLSELEGSNMPLQIENCNLNQLIQNLLPIFEKEIASKEINLKLELDKNIVLPLDSFRIEQVLINLIQNAIHYTENGEIVISLFETPSQVVLSVRDTGTGIPHNRLHRIFERFYVVNKSRSRQVGGTGLGLAIVRHIVELHGGTIRVKSKEGEGSCFTINLPHRLNH